MYFEFPLFVFFLNYISHVNHLTLNPPFLPVCFPDLIPLASASRLFSELSTFTRALSKGFDCLSRVTLSELSTPLVYVLPFNGFAVYVHCFHTAAVYKCSVSEDGNRGEIFSGSREVPQQPEVAAKLRDGSGSPDLTVNFIKKPNLKSRGGDCVLNPNQSVICQHCVFEIFDRI